MTTYIFFDIDDTLVKGTSWTKLHTAMGTLKETNESFKRWQIHNNADTWLQEDLKVLNYRGLTPLKVKEILGTPDYFKGVTHFFRVAKLGLPYNVELHLISGGFGPFVEQISSNLRVQNLLYHKILWDSDKQLYITDSSYTFNNKADAILNMRTYKPNDKIVVIGNGLNDIDMFKKADYSIGFNISDKDKLYIDPYLDVKFMNENFYYVSAFLLGVWGN